MNTEESPHTAVQPLFNEEVAFPSLKSLLISHVDDLKIIWRNQFAVDSFYKLQALRVGFCKNLVNVFQSNMLARFQSLEELFVRDCGSLEEVFELEELNVTETPAKTTIQLKKLNLYRLPKMKHVWNKDPQEIFSFQNLKDIEAIECESLKSIFPASVARCLTQLEELRMVDCGVLEEIVAGEEGAEAITTFVFPQVVFPNLETLQLSSIGLEDIHRATWSSCRIDMQSTSRFQNLLKLKVKGCGNIKYLLSFSTAKFMVHLKELRILECKAIEEILLTEDLGVVEEIILKVLFPRLEDLLLKELPILERFCQGSNIKFPSLTDLMIDHCPKLKTFISKMNTEESPHTAVQPLFNEEVALPSLERLGIYHVDDLKTIWWNQFAVDSFYKLQVLAVLFCKNLVNVFQSNMLARFQSLEELFVRDCGSLEEVFELEELNVTETPAKTTIQLKKLYLGDLPNMRHVWSKDPKPIFSFQNLKDIRAVKCESLKSLFPASVARCLTQLEELHILDCGVLEEIVAGEEGAEAITRFVFPQVSNVRLHHLPRLKCFYPGRHASEWPMLKEMEVCGCHEVDIFASQLLSETVEESQLEISVKQPLFLVDEVVFPNLETLQLSSIGLEDIQHNQHRATTSSCRLENMQSTSRFQNLLKLMVNGCDNIKYLLSFSTAKFMVHLKYLSIVKCKAMEEILLTEDSGVVEEIIPQLEDLVLYELPILERFCQGSNIKFPSLKYLTLDHCPKLKTFISKMNTEESPDTAVQPLFNEDVAFPSLERLFILNVDDLKIIWRNQFAVGSFYKLQALEVGFCKNLVNVFQSDMMARFQSLEELLVKDCGSLEVVFELKGLNVREAHAVTAIQLKELYLKDLPNMKHVWSKDPKQIFSFKKLQRVRVMGCRGLKSLFPASVARCLTQLEELRISSCGVLEEIVAGEEAAQQIARFVFPQVTVLHLARLPRLNWFYPGVHTSEWPMLKDMLVADCQKVEIFASELSSFQDILLRESKLGILIKQPLFLVNEATFPSLEKLRIAYMFHLKIIWHSQFTADSFCKPQTPKVECCENLIDQETCVVTPIQLKELHLIHLPKLKHIWNEDPQQIFSFPSAEEDFLEIERFQLLIFNAAKEIHLMLETE